MNVDETKQRTDAEKPPRRRWRGWRLALLFLGGAALGWLGAMGCSSTRNEPDYQLIGQAWSTIQREYVDRSAVDSRDLTYGAISGMVDALGDTGHSAFLTPEMVKALKGMERGEFKGIGVEIQMKNGHVVIVAPLDGSPAQKAGLRAGEIILKVAGEDISDWPLSRVVEKILGPVGTSVRLTLQEPHNEHLREVTVKRASIKLHEVTWHRLPGTDIAHLRIASFDAGVTKDLRLALKAIQQQRLKGIVLDLRNDPGGLLDEAVGVASQFLNGGTVLLMKDAQGKVVPMPADKGGMAADLPIAVLVNEGTASAAEIVAGALEDRRRAPLIGETTFGTGTVLGQFRLADGSALLLAIEEWLTPKGRSFWHKGLRPQYEVKLPPETSPLLPTNEKDLTPEQLQSSEDRQLLTALKLVGQAARPVDEERPRVQRQPGPLPRAGVPSGPL